MRSPPSTAEYKATPDPEVIAKASRRRFTAEYKLRILEEIEAAGPGGAGTILRREGLYSSHLTAWRRARRDGALRTLGRKRGRKKAPEDPSTKRIGQLEKELARTREELRRAQLIIDVQGMVNDNRLRRPASPRGGRPGSLTWIRLTAPSGARPPPASLASM